jgi:hypothetical protein
VVPDVALETVEADRVELLILPGGDIWAGGEFPQAQLAMLFDQLVPNATPVRRSVARRSPSHARDT